DVVNNLFLGREERPGGPARAVGWLDEIDMERRGNELLRSLSVRIPSVRIPVAALSGGQRQSVAIARSLIGEPKVVLLDEPTAALGVKEGNMVLELIRRVRDKGLSVILISHNMPHVFEIADRIHVARLGKRAAVLDPKKISMSDTVAVMTGALPPEQIPRECLAEAVA
ncbi:ATP-binding cassette domain-containing protein, partial [Ideonella sp.]|uniref:ATP-binding cassette domain-containing protein n=1 Tax=Ideonella sp. TaxID=1929293 RepID=UPI002B4702D6